jgi:hypothetical protein
LKAEVKYRIHIEGKAEDGSQIGEYSDGYMKFRTGKFKNGSNEISRGKRKGQPRPLGYGKRLEGKNVVLSLSRQMEKDFDATQPVKIEGGYGIGFSNDFNYDKAVWNEKRYGKVIYGISEKERELAEEIVSEYVNNG